MTNRRVFHQWPGKPAGWQFGMAGYGGRPDGAAVDVQGNYWVAMFEGARLLKLSPAGELLADIPVPAQCPTMPCFGGDDLQTLYITTARYNRPAAELRPIRTRAACFPCRWMCPACRSISSPTDLAAAAAAKKPNRRMQKDQTPAKESRVPLPPWLQRLMM
jgi:hypothetical protein